MEVPFPQNCVENFVLERLNISETIVAPRDGDRFSLIVGHALSLGISISCRRIVEINHILHAGSISQATNKNRVGRGACVFAELAGLHDPNKTPARKATAIDKK